MKYKDPLAMKEIHDIRVALYEERKGLSPKEKVALTNKRAKEVIEKYALKADLISRVRDFAKAK